MHDVFFFAFLWHYKSMNSFACNGTERLREEAKKLEEGMSAMYILCMDVLKFYEKK